MISATLPDCEMSQGCVALISSVGMGARIAAGAAVAKRSLLQLRRALLLEILLQMAQEVFAGHDFHPAKRAKFQQMALVAAD